MTADRLSPDEIETLYRIYQRDVKYWDNWGLSVKLAKRNGSHPMGLTWVLLCYKPGVELPNLRQQMNQLYLSAMHEYAQHYHLCICVDARINKIMLYDPSNVKEEWLSGCELPPPR